MKADKAAGIDQPDDLDVLLGPIPIEYDPDLDRGLTPDLEPEAAKPEQPSRN